MTLSLEKVVKVTVDEWEDVSPNKDGTLLKKVTSPLLAGTERVSPDEGDKVQVNYVGTCNGNEFVSVVCTS